MKAIIVKFSLLILAISVLAGCNSSSSTATSSGTTAAIAIARAAADAANDSSVNHSAPFTVLQNAGVPAVTVNSVTKINFTVFSDGAVKTGLTTSNMSFAIAKLVPGTSGNPDQWENYIYRTESTANPPNNIGSNGGGPVLASAQQPTTDAKVSTQLEYNAEGYYTYTFSTDITDATTRTNGLKGDLTQVTYEPTRTHRIAIQLSYTNGAGETVRANPYFDFTIDASGNAVAVTDPGKTRVMTDVTSCNSCHNKLALHGGGRVDTQFCVMCHNANNTDANSGHVLDMRTMAHKIHAGKRIAAKGEDYAIWGYASRKADYAEVGFPQDLRNCTKCHTSANANTPQGDNWKNKPSKEACLTCHQPGTSLAPTTWYAIHITGTAVNSLMGSPANAAAASNSYCINCHSAASNWGPEQVHWNQNEKNAAKYKMNIDSVTYDATNRKATISYYLSDPTNSNAVYDLVVGCASPTSCSNTTKFGNLRFVLGYQNLAGQPTTTSEFSSYNNGGSGVNNFAYRGTNNGSNRYTLELTVPADTATMIAAGTARVVSYGQVIEQELNVITRVAKTNPVADNCVNKGATSPNCNLNVSVQHTLKEVALSGTLTPRREIVSNDKCNACHSLLGTASASNILTNAFHGGARDIVEACVICHDSSRISSSVMADGNGFNESFQFKRLVHGIHGGTKRTFPYTRGNTVVGNGFAKDGTPLSGGPAMTPGTVNFTSEVVFPGHLWDCNTCHVNNAYQRDRGSLGTIVNKPTGVTDPLGWKIFSPKAASCSACHDSAAAQTHMTTIGGATFGSKTQGDYLAGGVQEGCDSCHAPGVVIGTVKTGVDVAHGLK